jgi:hypothetical protein
VCRFGYSGGPGTSASAPLARRTSRSRGCYRWKAKLSECDSTDGVEQVRRSQAVIAGGALPACGTGSADSWMDLSPRGFHGGARAQMPGGIRLDMWRSTMDNRRHPQRVTGRRRASSTCTSRANRFQAALVCMGNPRRRRTPMDRGGSIPDEGWYELQPARSAMGDDARRLAPTLRGKLRREEQ